MSSLLVVAIAGSCIALVVQVVSIGRWFTGRPRRMAAACARDTDLPPALRSGQRGMMIVTRLAAGVLLVAHGLVRLLYLAPGAPEFSLGRVMADHRLGARAGCAGAV